MRDVKTLLQLMRDYVESHLFTATSGNDAFNAVCCFEERYHIVTLLGAMFQPRSLVLPPVYIMDEKVKTKEELLALLDRAMVMARDTPQLTWKARYES